MILPKPRPSTIALWASLAVLNLSAGAVIATWPARQADLDTMHRWGRAWLFHGENIYESAEEAPDYPPHAIIALSPLAALPMERAVPLWAAINLALGPLAAFLAVRIARPKTAAADAILPVLMFLCWSGFRALLQFSLPALVFGLLSMATAGRRPILGGLLLGMSLMKPQIAAPFFLWAVFTRRPRVVAISLAVVLGGVAVYCFSVDYSLVEFASRYAGILHMFYGGDAIMLGLAQVRPLVMLVASSGAAVDVVAFTVAGLMLLAICAAGFQEGKPRPTPALMFSAPAMAGIWSLLTFYHLTYGFLLLLPTATLLIFLDDPVTFAYRRNLFRALQFGLMFDAMTLWRWFGPALGIPPEVGLLVSHADRVLMLILFGLVAVLFVRTRRAFSPETTSSAQHTKVQRQF